MTAMSGCPACAAAPLAQEVASRAEAAPDLILSVPDVHCAACIGKIERHLSAQPDVQSARVNLSLKRVAVQTRDADPDRIVTALAEIGFEAHPLDPSLLGTRQDAVGRGLLMRMAIAGFAMMNVMLFSVAVWSGASDATREMFHLLSAVISLPAVLFCGKPFFANAWSALKVGQLNMDVPISLAILLAAGMSLFEVLNDGHHAYFDAALSLTFFLLIGRYLDHQTRGAARSAAKELAALEVHTAQRIGSKGAERVAVSDLVVGDRVLIPSGVRMPVDGTLTSASAQLDRSFLTGESSVAVVAKGAEVHAGEINLGAPLEIRVRAVGEDTTLRRVAAMVETAENSRNSYTNLADRAARIYAPAVHLLAFAAFAVWVWIDGDVRHALNVAVAVLIITCPCALGLAVPAVATAAIARLYALGFLVKSGTALERIAEVDTAVFDKTGTLTRQAGGRGAAVLTDRQAGVALALAQASDHPVSRAVAQMLDGHAAAAMDQITEVPGRGMTALLGEVEVRLGHGRWLEASFEGLGLQIGSEPAVAMQLQEEPRDGAADALNGLRALGLRPQLLSGDRQDAVHRFAQRMGIDAQQAEVSATDKHAYLSDLQAAGHHVLMVGDGLNDTASLAVAHASVAPSSALDASRNAADVVILNDTLTNLPLLVRVARAMTVLSKQNFAIALAYNAVAVPIALLGFATPLIAAIAMSVSSITVLLNAMRVRMVS